MKHSPVVIAVILLKLGLAIDCPVVECEGLTENLCAWVDSGKLKLNTNACDTGFACSLASVLDWWQQNRSGEYVCVPYPATLRNTTLPAYCEQRSLNRNFKAGYVHIDCRTDQDCILEDNSVTPGSCQCTMRSSGLGLCVPDLSSIYYDSYWNDCTSDSLQRPDEFNFWAFYHSMWIYLQGDVPCTSYFVEVDTLTTLYIFYQQASAQNLLLAAILLIGN